MSFLTIRRKNIIMGLLIGLLASILLASLTVFIFMKEGLIFSEKTEPKVEFTVIAAAKPLAVGKIIEADDIKEVKVSRAIENTMSKEDIIGKEISINAHESLPLTADMFHSSRYDKEDRIYEFRFIDVPDFMVQGDMVDVRIRYATGEDYVVAVRKEIVRMTKEVNGENPLIELALDESEILAISSAFVDDLSDELCDVYLVKYPDRYQTSKEPNYPPNESVLSLIKENPNILLENDVEKSIKARIILDKNLGEVAAEGNGLVGYQAEGITGE